MSVFSAPSFSDHERVCFHHDRESGLRAIVAVHDTTLGPAVGGCRMYPYACDADALDDVLRLSLGMTYKSALAGLPLGGGKSVIIGDPRRDKTPALLRAMGRFIDSLGGRYVAAEDSGTSVADLRSMASQTSYVSGIDGNEHGGDPSPSTARGVFSAIRAALRHRLGSDELAETRVAIQGLGAVGYNLATLLRAEGAQVLAADPDEERAGRAARELGVEIVPCDEILFADADVLAPCAMGGALNARSIPRLRAGIVAGAANNQLRDPDDAARLSDRGILYCPDFLINAGGIIDVYHQRQGLGGEALLARVDAIGARLTEVLQRADQGHRPTNAIAEELAREILERGRPQEAMPRQVA
jgi:leucine dehydrogenase